MISKPTISCSHWWEFVYTKCYHDVILRTSLARSSLSNFLGRVQWQHRYPAFCFILWRIMSWVAKPGWIPSLLCCLEAMYHSSAMPIAWIPSMVADHFSHLLFQTDLKSPPVGFESWHCGCRLLQTTFLPTLVFRSDVGEIYYKRQALPAEIGIFAHGTKYGRTFFWLNST